VQQRVRVPWKMGLPIKPKRRICVSSKWLVFKRPLVAGFERPLRSWATSRRPWPSISTGRRNTRSMRFARRSASRARRSISTSGRRAADRHPRSKGRMPGHLLGGFGFKHGVDVACSVQDADDFNAIVCRTVEDQVLLETLDPPYPQPGQAWMG
jgi:hypothetical protein